MFYFYISLYRYNFIPNRIRTARCCATCLEQAAQQRSRAWANNAPTEVLVISHLQSEKLVFGSGCEGGIMRQHDGVLLVNSRCNLDEFDFVIRVVIALGSRLYVCCRELILLDKFCNGHNFVVLDCETSELPTSVMSAGG